jgi:hypothetical protein
MSVYPHFLDGLDSFHSRGSVRISVFWVLSKLVKLLMQSFYHVLYIIRHHHHQLMQYDLHCIPEILTVTSQSGSQLRGSRRLATSHPSILSSFLVLLPAAELV